MKQLFFALALLPAFLGAANLLDTPPVEWKRDFRPDNRKDIYDVTALPGGTTRLRRFTNSAFGRIYRDLSLKPGAGYQLDYTQTTEHGVLTKMLVIFKGSDGKWREQTRLSFFEPLVNGEKATASIRFLVPEDAVETRIDYRLDSFGTVNLGNVSLTELSPEEAEAFRKSREVKPFTPGTGGDYALTPGKYYRVSFEGKKVNGETGEFKLRFHYPETGFHRDGHIYFFLREDRPVKTGEIIVVPDTADGCRAEIINAEIKAVSFTETT